MKKKSSLVTQRSSGISFGSYYQWPPHVRAAVVTSNHYGGTKVTTRARRSQLLDEQLSLAMWDAECGEMVSGKGRMTGQPRFVQSHVLHHPHSTYNLNEKSRALSSTEVVPE